MFHKNIVKPHVSYKADNFKLGEVILTSERLCLMELFMFLSSLYGSHASSKHLK
jgi:hypothetical protein